MQCINKTKKIQKINRKIIQKINQIFYMKENTLNLNHFLSAEHSNSEIDLPFSSDNKEIENYLLNQRNYDIPVNLDFQINQKEIKENSYRPKKIRGCGILREGFCFFCKKWFKLKTSSYWYHMNYKHGISSKGNKYPNLELHKTENKIMSFCKLCNDYVFLCFVNGRKNFKYSWYKHFQKIHKDI